MGSVGETPYSVPKETQKLFENEILKNALIPSLPEEINEAAKLVHFSGNDLPSIPINWRFAESAAVMKAFEASMLNVLRARKYGVEMSEVSINTDHASLFFMSPFLAQLVNPDGTTKQLNAFGGKKEMAELGFPSCDLHNAGSDLNRILATNIYKTKDGRCYHVHGSLNPDPTLTALELSLYGQEGDTYDSVVERIQSAVATHDSAALDELMNKQYKQAGTIAWSVPEFTNSEHGKANEMVALYELKKAENYSQPASWWPENSSMPSSAKRPLAGLKVVDLTRIIAAPTITRSLAEMGASVMRVTSSTITDMGGLHQDLNWGKWNCQLDLKTDEGRKALTELIKEADVVVEGYRPGAMARNGFGREDIFELVKDRDRGIIHLRENCYGWNGPWQNRSGWQQISDACCGVSLEFGNAMGNDEAVTPVFPNSDYCTGIAGSVAVMHALIRRAEEGGSYGVDAALNYYSQWLTKSVDVYPFEVWNDLWKRNGSPVYRHYHCMHYLLPEMIGRLVKYSKDILFRPEFYEHRESKAVGHTFVQVKPIAQFKAGEVELKYNVGTRGNGVDAARWPDDLGVEVVT